jgi:putative endonuclease
MTDALYYTYIVSSRSLNLYIGMTSQIEIRINQHKAGTFEGHSKKYNCNRLV